MKKILIAIPTNKFIEPSTFKAIYDLKVPEGYKTEFQFFFGYQVDQIRNLIAEWGQHYDYLFSVDSDISFASDTLEKMIKHDKDMVSGLYIQRIQGTHHLEIYKKRPEGGGNERIKFEECKDTPLMQIAACGLGCVLIKGKVLKDVGYPQFTYHSALNHANTISEDVDFCRKAGNLGFELWADTTIRCDHTGDSTFKVGQINKAVDMFAIDQAPTTSATMTAEEPFDKTAKDVVRTSPGIDPVTGKYSLEVNEGDIFTGDSIEYGSLATAVKMLRNPIGVSMEIGVRLGLGSKTIMDAYRHYHPTVRANHLGVDPYGNIDYAASDSVLARKFNYDNKMRQRTLGNFAQYYPEFHLVNLEDTEFMNRFKDGFPIYEENKIMLEKYEMIHFDGPHDTASVIKEAAFFNERKADQTIWVFDDISGLNWNALMQFMTKAGFGLAQKGDNKATFEYNKS